MRGGGGNFKKKDMRSSYKNGVFNFEIDGYAVELYKENDLWLDKVYTLFGHVINRVSSEKSTFCIGSNTRTNRRTQSSTNITA